MEDSARHQEHLKVKSRLQTEHLGYVLPIQLAFRALQRKGLGYAPEVEVAYIYTFPDLILAIRSVSSLHTTRIIVDRIYFGINVWSFSMV